MSDTQRKLLLLGLLTAVMAYVWWPNSSTDTSKVVAPALSSAGDLSSPYKEKSEERSEPLLYRSPQVNPFVNDARGNMPAKAGRPSVTKEEAIPPFAGKLLGITLAKERPQVVLEREDGSSSALGMSDTIGVWKIISITKSAVILGHGRQRDTLHVESP